MSEEFNNDKVYDDGEGIEIDTVTLTMEDDSEVDCAVLAIYEIEDKSYIALLPIDENGEPQDNADILIYRYIDNGDDEPGLENIETDEEYEIAADGFDEIMDSELFDEMDDEE